MACLFIALEVSFERQKFLILMKLSFLMDCVFGIISNKTVVNQECVSLCWGRPTVSSGVLLMILGVFPLSPHPIEYPPKAPGRTHDFYLQKS